MKKKLCIIIPIVIVVITAGVLITLKIKELNKINEIYGLIINVDNNTIQVKSGENIYNFNITNTTKPETNLIANDIAKITYKGKLEDNKEAIKVSSIQELITDNFDISTVKTDKLVEEDDTNYITGKVIDITDNTITIKANMDGNEYCFNTQNTQKDNEIVNDDIVKIVHKGTVKEHENEETNDAISIHKLNNEDQKAQEQNTIMGIVKEARNNVLVIEADEKLYAFFIGDTEKEVVVSGEIVRITFKGKLSENSVITAIEYKKQ